MTTTTEMQTKCGLCGHEMSTEMCGLGFVQNDTEKVHLCHAATHDCYVRWTVHGERPITEDDERIEEVRALMHAFDNVTPGEMTDFFYMHAYNELDLAVRDLLAIFDRRAQ